VIEIEENRYGDPVPVRPRLGQGTFRIAVMQAYRGACAITTEHSLPALEAAHIQPFAEGGRHEVRNGLFLRSDLHRLFDRGYVTVTPDCVFRVGDRLREDYANGHTYYPLNGRRLVLPGALEERPARELLAWHGERVFLG
jgi:putative restriction endonuclease